MRKVGGDDIKSKIWSTCFDRRELSSSRQSTTYLLMLRDAGSDDVTKMADGADPLDEK